MARTGGADWNEIEGTLNRNTQSVRADRLSGMSAIRRGPLQERALTGLLFGQGALLCLLLLDRLLLECTLAGLLGQCTLLCLLLRKRLLLECTLAGLLGQCTLLCLLLRKRLLL